MGIWVDRIATRITDLEAHKTTLRSRCEAEMAHVQGDIDTLTTLRNGLTSELEAAFGRAVARKLLPKE